MKKIMFTFYAVSILVSVAFSFLMNVKTWAEFLKNIICSALASSIVILVGQEQGWSSERITLGIVVASGYARPVVYGINSQIKEFFKDPKAYIDKYKDKR